MFTGKCLNNHESSFDVPPHGTRGYLACPSCGLLVGEIDVTPWDRWTWQQTKKKRRLPTRSHHSVDDTTISKTGLRAELAACLCLCPGYLGEWIEHAEQEGRNIGRDLLGEWIGLPKDVEVKHTEYHSARTGILYLRRPAGRTELIPERDIPDSVFVLFHGRGYRYFGCCWSDKTELLAKGAMNPPPMPPGKPVFGGLCSLFRPFETLVGAFGLQPLQARA